MGRVGSALDNAVIDSWHSTLEFELRGLEHFATKAQARRRSHASLAFTHTASEKTRNVNQQQPALLTGSAASGNDNKAAPMGTPERDRCRHDDARGAQTGAPNPRGT
jgi:hypothetical protein